MGDTCVPTQDDGWLVYKVLNIHIFDAEAAVEDKEPCVSSVNEQMNANSLTIKKMHHGGERGCLRSQRFEIIDNCKGHDPLENSSSLPILYPDEEELNSSPESILQNVLG